MATIDDDLAKSVTEGFRQAQIDIVNQDLILSGTGDVTVTLADGSKKTGPSWSKLITAANAAGTSAAAAKTSETNALASKNAAAQSATNAATSEGNALASKNATKTSETNAKTSETNAKTSENNAKTSETNAATSLAAAQLLTSVPYEEAPFPDVWLPLNDDMRLLAGYAPYDRLTISGQILDLASKSATFTRLTTGTYIDKCGVMQTAAINEPRFEREGLLMEGVGTNLYTYSEQWGTGSRVTTTNNSGDSPRGDKTMALLVEDTASAEHYAQDRNIVLTSGTIYCYSVFVKAHTNSRLLYLRVATGTTAGVFFDPVAGAFVGGAVGAHYLDRGFDDLGNGLYRVWMSLTAGATQSSVFRLQLAKDGVTASYAGDGVSGLYIWGAQLEAGPVPTSYIPTEGSTVTRGADYWNLLPENVGYKTLATKFKRTVAFEVVVKGFGPSASNYVDIVRVAGSNNDIICRLSSANRLTSYRDGGGTFVSYIANTPGVLVHKIDGDEYSLFFNGSTATRTQVPVSNTTSASAISNTTGPSGTTFVYHIRNFRIWHRLLTLNQIKGLR
ncbi:MULTISPECIES: phage head spike fiber domain-containing protein [unclassified Leclercia]|uniref:phage head spike fiber domain-containing protein n=1 Tax=unclassified Leclercia TaxID=2627398 RepID=UPI0025BD8C92|nr:MULTISPECIES: hypothetical protein [unclassified Leclercia]